MAFTAETFSDVTPFGGFIFHPRKYKNLLSGIAVVGAGLTASTWLIATIATMQTLVMPLGGNELAQVSFPVKAAPPLVQHERVIHAAKSFRLSSSSTTALTAEAIQAHGMKLAAAEPRNAQFVLARSPRIVAPPVLAAAAEVKAPETVAMAMPSTAAAQHADIAALAPVVVPVLPEKTTAVVGLVAAAESRHSSLVPPAKPAVQAPAIPSTQSAKLGKDDVLKPSAIAKAEIAAADQIDRIIIPPKSVVEAAGEPIILAMAPPAPAPIAPAAKPMPVMRPSSAPQIAALTTASVPPVSAQREMAAVSPKPDIAATTDAPETAEASPQEPFGLVLAQPDDDAVVPLPMARPSGMAKISPPATDRSTRAPEPLLAYAKTDEDDDDDEMPAVKKPYRVPGARNGVAIYDISAGTVYLPGGERLEAHSGIGKMRDNPRYVNQKNRGPTPPHTYDLRMRESLFHGVEAIRLTPVEGEDAIFGRNGLLAHTYMLGRAGDSNGCVSFKDYRRFLAAFKRGEIKQLVVVPKLSGAPATSTPTLASLFSSRS